MALLEMGASALTICSAYGFLAFSGKYDLSRMAANVASGVGFVGPGDITECTRRGIISIVSYFLFES
jgi:uncharacterized membrane protein YhiD involved in acid resistance